MNMRISAASGKRQAISFFGMMLLLLASGCVRRTLTIRSEPPGAKVYLNGQEIGTTPLTVPFTYYTAQEIRLEKDGFKTVVLKKVPKAPAYEWLGVDLLSEVMLPAELLDRHSQDAELPPSPKIDPETLKARAEAAKERVEALTPWQSNPNLDLHGPRRLKAPER